MSFPSISIFSERSSSSTVRYSAPNTGAPLTAGRSGAHPEMRGKAALGNGRRRLCPGDFFRKYAQLTETTWLQQGGISLSESPQRVIRFLSE
jgi:hypothetical protein